MVAPTGTTSNTYSDAGTTAAPTSNQQLASKETFLQLLVAQIKNQNPLSPADGVQFLTQLAQFTELEQLIDMRADLSKIRESLTAEASENSGGTDMSDKAA